MGIEFRELVAVVFLSRTLLYYSTCLRSEYLQREGNMPVSAKTVQSVRSVGHQNRGRASSSRRVAAVASENTLGGVVFSPFDEVEGSLKLVREGAKAANVSLARQNFSAACESALNEQISIEFNVSYVYAAMHAYFDRDNVALPGLAKFFLESSHEEREHAEMLMKYQNERGGRVKFSSLLPPQTEFGGDNGSGDALYAMELTLSLEKLVNEKLLTLHAIADEENDPQMADYIEGNFLNEQVEAIKKISDYVAQLRRVGEGHGVYHWDSQLE